MLTKRIVNDVSYNIIKAAIEVHNNLGPGLLESIYEDCMVYELKQTFNYSVERQANVTIHYKGQQLGKSLRLDLLIEGHTILELKAVDKLLDVHQAQLISYMRLANKPKGILINFNTTLITKSAIHLVNELFADLPSE